MSKGDTAVLAVSCGCACEGARRRSLDRIEEDIRAAYPDCIVRSAWTSRILRQRVWEQEGIRIPSVEEALQELIEQGIREAAVQPLHMLNGSENQRMTEEIRGCQEKFARIVTGAPLLASDEDKRRTMRAVIEEIQLRDGEALVLMGHGSRAGADAVYEEIDEMFREEGRQDIFLGTMSGKLDFENVLCRAAKRRPKRILLAPFMIAAGKHTFEDLCGRKDSSWKSRFEAAGYPVECILKGMGEYEKVRRIFTEHVEQSMSFLDK